MAGSGALREKKRESVQFWLAIAAVSFLFHALLIVGIKRWATIAVVEPDSGPIAVELVDSVGDAEPQGEPIVQAAVLKPEAKLEVTKPEVKPEVQPEPEVKPEPIVQPSVQPKIEKKKPTIASTPKPDRSLVSPKKNTKSGSSGPKKAPPKGNQNSSPSSTIPPITSDDPLGNPGSGAGGSNLTTSLAPPVLRSTPGEIGGKGTAKLKLNFPTTVPFPATFALKSGDVIRVKVGFVVLENKDIQSFDIKELQPKLSGREQDALLGFIEEQLGKISVADILIDNDAIKKPDTDWETTIELRL
jgi:outer membrane biosynthesis protein TonB